jgi:hypothetical protein
MDIAKDAPIDEHGFERHGHQSPSLQTHRAALTR